MAVSYSNLWKTLNNQNLKKTDLREIVGLSSSTIAKLSQNKTVTTDVLNRIGIALNCNIEDIIEIQHDENTETTNPDGDSVHTVISVLKAGLHF